MSNNRHNFVGVLVVAIVILVFQFILLIHSIHHMQGNAKVVNYTGIVRGATQRLVKNELYGINQDDLIEELDMILEGLENGGTKYNLTVLDDNNYLSKLSILKDEWKELKSIIYDYRVNTSKEKLLFDKSESYFLKADNVVSAAANYSDGIAHNLTILQITISINILFMMFLLFIQLFLEIQANGKLNEIAYVDLQTSLPNKRGCEEKINEYSTLLEGGSDICAIVFDLNNLKYCNDTYGHVTGDNLIIKFASLLRLCMPEEMFVGRFGGDEFIAFMDNPNEDDIMDSITELKKRASATGVGNASCNMTISFAYGLCTAKENPNISLKGLLDIADKRMYENKVCMKRMVSQ